MNQVFLENIKALAKKNYTVAKIIGEYEADVKELDLSVRRELQVDVVNDCKKSGMKGNMLFLFGIGNGSHLHYYHNNAKPIHSFIIDNNIKHLKFFLSKYNVSGLIENNRLHFIFPSQTFESDIYELFFKNQEIKTFLTGADFVVNSSCVLIEEEYNFFIKTIKEISRASFSMLHSYGNSPDDSMIGLKHILGNIIHTYNNPGIIELKDKFKGVPGIVVAAGPSLKKNMHLLKEVEGKAITISVDTALKPLLKEEIFPTMVTSIERGEGVINYFNDIPKETAIKMRSRTIFSCATVLRPEIFNLANRNGWRIMPVFRKMAHYEWLKHDKGIIESGKSSANLAYNMLVYMGCSPIILIGQDLAFGSDDKTHIDGADHSIDGMKKSSKIREILYVKGNYQDTVKTIKTWDLFRSYYETDIKNRGVKTINSTEGGAYINGSELMTFKEAIDRFCVSDSNYPEILRGIFENFDMKNDLQEVIDKIKEAFPKMDEWCNMCDEGIELLNQDKIMEAEKTMMRIQNDEGRASDFYFIMMHIVQAVSIATNLKMCKEKNNRDNTRLIICNWFMQIKELIKETKRVIKDGIGRVK